MCAYICILEDRLKKKKKRGNFIFQLRLSNPLADSGDLFIAEP